MTVTIRHLQGQEMLDTLFEANMYAFHPSPPYRDREEWMESVGGRKGVTCHAVMEDGTPASLAVSTAMTQNMRGKLYPASGVWGVSTHPSARRKGYCRQAMASLLSAERMSGKVFSNLYPFRESFYERMGYVSYPLTKIAKFSPSSLAPVLKWDLEGSIELKLIGEAYDAYRAYLAKMRQTTHGMAFFDFGDQSTANRNRLWAALARIGGEVEGIMLYRLQGEEVTKLQLIAVRFYSMTSRARYLLLDWIARHVDQADQAEIWLAADEYPETWLADFQPKVESAVRAAMTRVLDVEKLGGMRVGKGSFAASITDRLCPWNEGFWQFESRGNQLKVSKSSGADCELTIQGLTALVAGSHDPQDFALHGWGNPHPALQTILRQMFPRMCPFMHENF